MIQRSHRSVHPRTISSRRPCRGRATTSKRVRAGRFSLPHVAILIVILAVATVLRFAGIGWGDNHYLHPDERYMTMVAIDTQWPSSVAQYFDSETSPLNPFNTIHSSYVYGTLPLFLAKLVGTITNDVVYGDAHLPGRWLSAVADVGVVALGFWIGRRLFSSTAGLIAAALLAFTPLHIQNAHYFTTDSVSTFFAVAVFAAVLRAWDRKSWRWYVFAGLCVGFATASKPNLAITAGFLAIPVLESIRLRGWRSLLPPWRWRPTSRRDAIRFPVVLGVAVSAIAAALAFRVAQPYAFVGPNFWDVRLDQRWTDNLDYWRQVQSGVIDVPPSIQWADRTPVVFIVDNLV
ncbi:MAG: glycosyltransferase family 39 protein [Chloroflexia bacterium]|nr:glycosyltransferase family 39 protein [Chloroflexia bacterium]